MRCPTCGATNAASAAWCGQCYTTLRPHDPGPAPPHDPGPAPPHGPGPAPPLDPGRGPAVAQPDGLRVEGFRRQADGTVQWACAVCGQYSSVDDLRCRVCGAGFDERYRPGRQPEPIPNWAAALVLSALLPGAGHLAINRYGAGLARVLLFAVWLLGASLLTGAAGGGAGIAAAPLWLGAGALWTGSMLDVARLRRGDPELLGGRVLLWLVVAVTLLLSLGVVAAAAGGV